MRVLHILNTGSFSGAENVAIQIIKNVKKSFGVDSLYLSLDGPICDVLRNNGIKFIPVKRITIGSVRTAIKSFRPDVVHAHDFTATFIASLFPGVRIFSHLHNNDPKMRRLSTKSLLFLFSSKRVERVFAVSPAVEQEYIFKNRLKRHFDVIGNPIDVRSIRDRAMERDFRTFYDIAFIGRLTEQKNPLLLLEIIKQVASCREDLKVAIVGDGPLRGEVKKQISLLGIGKNVDLMGFVSNPLPLLKHSKLLCVPSKWEGFGLVAVEALALSVPVVCSNVGGLPQIVEDSCGKICNCTEDFCKEIVRLLTDDVYYSGKREKAALRGDQLDNISSYISYIFNAYNGN